MECKVVVGFPGIGKSYLDKTEYKSLDLESSEYSWRWKNGEKTNKRDISFPTNYIDKLEEEIRGGKYDIICISSHDLVRAELKRRGIPFIAIYPENTEESKGEYIQRYKDRGSDENFIQLLKDNFSNFVEALSFEENHLELKQGEFLADVLERI